MDEDHFNDATRLKPQAERESERLARISSHALLAGAREMIIEHEGREYRLRVTAQRKLILTA
ncbi:MAG: hemin uptake protein HemP [Pseudomonadota bacterium]